MAAQPELERAFTAGLFDPAAAQPEDLVAWNGATASRYGVYRNNVTVGLIGVLRKRFPVCERLVGEEFFRAMARDFVRASPPRSPLLISYGDAFPDFIAGFAPAASVPYLADVARLEYACGRAYHALNAAPLKPRRTEDFPQETWGELVFTLHPSTELIASPWPIVAIWATNTHDAEVKPVDLDAAEDALVVRPELEIEVRRLPPGGLSFLEALRRGEPLASAAEAGLAASAAFSLADNLVGLLSTGVAVDVRPGETNARRPG